MLFTIVIMENIKLQKSNIITVVMLAALVIMPIAFACGIGEYNLKVLSILYLLIGVCCILNLFFWHTKTPVGRWLREEVVFFKKKQWILPQEPTTESIVPQPYVHECVNFGAFPKRGELSVLYLDLHTHQLYIWSGKDYIAVIPETAVVYEPVLSGKELLNRLEREHCEVWTKMYPGVVDTFRKVNPDDSEDTIEEMVREFLQDPELFQVEFYCIKHDFSGNSYMVMMPCIPITWTTPPESGVSWTGEFAFLIQDTGMYSVVKDLKVCTIVVTDAKGEEKHALAKADNVSEILETIK